MTERLKNNKTTSNKSIDNKMTKKIIYFAFAFIAIVGVSTVTSCKKGENDPFISLKSRKARISGEWKLEKGTLTSTTVAGGIPSSSTTTYTGSTRTSNGNSDPYSETLTIDKDGTYEIAIVDDGYAYTTSGVWFFAGKVKDLDLKNKEAIVLNEQQYVEPGFSETYNGLYGGQVLMIDQLKNKEIVFKGEFSYNSGSGYTSSSTYDRTFEKQ